MDIGIIGYGKMGRMVEHEVTKAGHRVAFIADSSTEPWSKADVLIEFTQPESFIPNLERALEAGIPMVTGTTGWHTSMDKVTRMVEANEGSLLHASNFSIGVNIFFEMNKRLAHIMKGQEDYTVHIEETHHIEKKDSPSGTAITTAEGILASQLRLKRWELAHSEERSPDSLPITSHRIPEVTGIHTVSYESDVDRIILTHDAKDRRGYAMGAIMAATWLPGHKGLYTMKDVLSF